MASRVAARRLRILVGSRKRGDEEGPARKPEELDDRCQDADRCRDRDDLELVAREDLAEQHGERREQNGGQHEAVPGQLQPQAACVEAAEDDAGRMPEHGGVLEQASEQEEEGIERDRQRDQQRRSRSVEAQDSGACDSLWRNSQARRRPVTSAYRSTPLAPKFVNRSSMFAEIT